MIKKKEDLIELYEGIEMLIEDAEIELDEAHVAVLSEIKGLSDFLQEMDGNEFSELCEDIDGDLTLGDILNEDPYSAEILRSMGGDLKGSNVSNITTDPNSGRFGRGKDGQFGFNNNKKSGYSPFSLNNHKDYTPAWPDEIGKQMKKDEYKTGIFRLIDNVKKWLVKIVVGVVNKILAIGGKLFGLSAISNGKKQKELIAEMDKTREMFEVYMKKNDGKQDAMAAAFLNKLNDVQNTRSRSQSAESATKDSIIELLVQRQNILKDLDSGAKLSYKSTSKPTETGIGGQEMFGESATIDGTGVILLEGQSAQQFVVIDITRDLFDLQKAIEHFFKLFDNAYGSNGAHLYQNTDLVHIHQIMKKSMKEFSKGNVLPYEDAFGRILDEIGIDPKKIDTNLASTKLNTDKLRAAYMNTGQQCQKVLQVIGSKKIHSLTSLGQMTLYDRKTSGQLKNIIKIIDPRIKQGNTLMKQLEKSMIQFRKFGKELEKERFSINDMSHVTFNNPVNNKYDNYFINVQKMIQTIDLRLASLALYLKTMKDVQMAIEGLVGGKYTV